jgi:hypothetical protein
MEGELSGGMTRSNDEHNSGPVMIELEANEKKAKSC